jgi:acyl-CoA reductase-like NAD-dependent aldehyde dehydrogenase
VAPETGAVVVNALASVLPPGVLQLAQGDGTVGSYLVSHARVDMICMTGSSATGKKILESAAPQMKRLVLELGGKDPMIVCADADLTKAAKDAAEYSLSNTGQVCCSIERIYVAQDVYPQFQQLVTDYVSTNFKVGNGMEEGVNVGPLVSTIQRDIVASHVDDALQKGAKLLYQSNIPATDDNHGSFFPVTVIADVHKEMDMYTQETFGPVIALMPFDGSESEAIRLANDTEYGLSGAVYSQDQDKARRIASQIEAGQVGINCYAIENMNTACPWVGFKNSGYNYHSGVEGFHNFSLPKSLVFEPSDVDESQE